MEDSKELQKEEFLKLKGDQPKVGDVLSTLDGEPLQLSVGSRTEGGRKKVAVFCRAIVDLKRKGWFLENRNRGIICLVLPQSQSRLKKEGDTFLVEKLQVVRYTENGRAILCDVV